MTWLFPTLVFVFVLVSVAMVLIILVQRPQGGGLASAFGGGGNQDTAFGGRTGDALTIATVSAFALWLLVAIGLNISDNPSVAAAPEAVSAGNEGAFGGEADGPTVVREILTPTPVPAPSGLTPEETAALLSPFAPGTAPAAGTGTEPITIDRPKIDPGLEGTPSDQAPPPAKRDPAPAPTATPPAP